jgi:hypothetical protein
LIVFGHDWRARPAAAWLSLKAARPLRIDGAMPAFRPA